MDVRKFETVSIAELFDAAADARPETVYLIESVDHETGEWSNQGEAKIIFLSEDTALYVDEIQGYKLLTDLDIFESATTRFVPVN